MDINLEKCLLCNIHAIYVGTFDHRSTVFEYIAMSEAQLFFGQRDPSAETEWYSPGLVPVPGPHEKDLR